MNSLIPFILASIVLLIIPGPAVIYIVTRSIDQGRLAGIVSVLGIHIGTVIQIAAAALGLSALLVSSTLAFSIVKYLGAGYLIYLGIRKLLDKEPDRTIELTDQTRLRNIFLEGIFVNALNPKTALFFFAFLPQFITPGYGTTTSQILILGLIFIAMGLVTDGFYALLADMLGRWLKKKRLFYHMQRYFAGSIYILLGLVSAFSSSGKAK